MDWTNASENVTEHFTVGDCLTLHAWGRLGTEADGADFDKLLASCQVLEQVREVLGCAMNIHCVFRSTAYNLAQNILPPTGRDVHSMCIAADFDCGNSLSIQEVKDKLEPILDQLGIRMEKGTTNWIHVDTHSVGPSGRYFTP
jgi:hypothetical protein